MIRVFFIFSFFSFVVLYANPYKQLDGEVKLNLMVNYFLNKELKNIVPKKPVKKILEDDGLSIEPVKYEKYFNYIQRIKTINEGRKADQEILDEKEIGRIAFYNSKIKQLKKFYNKNDNLHPIINSSINKAFKVVYGNPIFKDIKYNEKENKVYGKLSVDNIYDVDVFKIKNFVIEMNKDKAELFMEMYEDIKPVISFIYDKDILRFNEIRFYINSQKYIANFEENNVNKTNDKIKLKIKINDDIFHLINNEDKK